MTPSEGVLQAWRAGGPLSARPVPPSKVAWRMRETSSPWISVIRVEATVIEAETHACITVRERSAQSI